MHVLDYTMHFWGQRKAEIINQTTALSCDIKCFMATKKLCGFHICRHSIPDILEHHEILLALPYTFLATGKLKQLFVAAFVLSAGSLKMLSVRGSSCLTILFIIFSMLITSTESSGTARMCLNSGLPVSVPFESAIILIALFCKRLRGFKCVCYVLPHDSMQ